MKEKNAIYSTKSTVEIKDLDTELKRVAMYLSIFDVMDSDYDVIKKGAFKKSIKERGPASDGNRKIAFLRQHDINKAIGMFESIEEDDKGLFAVAKLGNSQVANDAWEDYKDGIIREHSIGFQYVGDKMKYVEDKTMPEEIGGYWNISELKLFEGSAVTFGANEYTNVVAVMKSEDKKNYLQAITTELDSLLSALKSGQGSDDRLYGIEIRSKYLVSQLNSLASVEPFNKLKHSTLVEPTKNFDWSSVINQIKF
jgi:HK97 family phage prohead protease